MTRRGFLRGLLGVTLAGFLLALWSFWVTPAWRLRIVRWRILRDDWTGPPLRIVALSDFHVGEPYVGPNRIRRIVARANALDPDLVVLLGEYAAGHRYITRPVRIAEIAPILASLQAPQGVFAILGNHDWWDDKTAQRQGGGPNLYAAALEAAGIPVLSNSAVQRDGFWLAGLEDQQALLRGRQGIVGLDDLPGTLVQVPEDAPLILLAHEPDIFPNVPDRVALTLSGHTHGGQVRLFGWSPVVPSRFGNRYAWGHVREKGRDLVVSGGSGARSFRCGSGCRRKSRWSSCLAPARLRPRRGRRPVQHPAQIFPHRPERDDAPFSRPARRRPAPTALLGCDVRQHFQLHRLPQRAAEPGEFPRQSGELGKRRRADVRSAVQR